MGYRNHGPWLPVLNIRLLPSSSVTGVSPGMFCEASKDWYGSHVKLGVLLQCSLMDGSSAIIGYQSAWGTALVLFPCTHAVIYPCG